MNEVTWAVAGSGKTQSIADLCTSLPLAAARRTLALTYTQTGQRELAERLRRVAPRGPAPRVMGWYSFLLTHFVRPYLPRLLPGRRLRGFDFHGDPGRYAKGAARYLDTEGRAYRLHLAKLAGEVSAASDGAPVDRLSRMYDTIFIDEVQDLVGWDLEVLDQLLNSQIDVRMVGDVRQSLLETNPRDPKNKQYRGLALLDWFRAREERRLVKLSYKSETRRANQAIASFADGIFDTALDFPPTVSINSEETGHDGVFAVAPEFVDAYLDAYGPQCLRSTKASGRQLDLPYRNFGEVKGLTFHRVLIHPTGPIVTFLRTGEPLVGRSACGFYVGVTRAQHSVAIVIDERQEVQIPLARWRPS
ncbi:MAG: AAA family ATPase [Dehalococcoidia bacterium]